VAKRCLVVTIDTEVNKGADWRISNPVSFSSVTRGVPEVFSPLFDRHGVVPTYLLSPEVIDDVACVDTLQSLGARAELGTHLHSEFIEPQRRLSAANMAGERADALQKQYPREVESAKLRNLTALFRDRFGTAPTAFRAGRYGLSEWTLETLAGLGYLVDSSVTPGLRWNYAEGAVDFRAWTASPRRIETASGVIMEMPISIRSGSTFARWVRDCPAPVSRGLAWLAGPRARYHWLRPSWASGAALIEYATATREPVLNLMLHSMEVIPGASPYARSATDVQRIVSAMDALFEYCATERFTFSGITTASRTCLS
jgi:hypothetical protein